MFIKLSSFILGVFLFTVSPAWAQLSSVDQEALSQTQELLTDPSARSTFVNGNTQAQKANAMVDQLVQSPEQKEVMFKLASEIFGDLVQSQSGDAKGTAELLKKAASDPESFYRGLSSEQRSAIEKLSSEISGPSVAPAQ